MNTNLLKKIVATALAFMTLTAHADTCDMSDAMQSMQTAERNRRNTDIDTRTASINSINDVMNQCLDNFPGYPTNLPNTAAFNQAYTYIKKQSCQYLISRAQQAGQAANNAINSQIGNVQQTVDDKLKNVGLTRQDAATAVGILGGLFK